MSRGSLTELRNGRVYDPLQGIDGEVRSIFFGTDGRIAPPPRSADEIREVIDLAGCVVMAGGVDTRELSQQTLQSRHSGLYFIGEVVDVTGWLGGYNFQWAWASAHACALALPGS